jgi:acyl-CoA reductase-like NAD-dependent aldehyde dehydrogenase
MKQPDKEIVAEIVDAVLARLDQDAREPVPHRPASRSGSPLPAGCLYDDVDLAVEATRQAQRVWAGTSRETKERVIVALRKAMHENAEEFARLALEETGMGRYEDKLLKHHQAADATPGLEDLETRSWTGDKGLVYEDYGPYGVIAAITPSTHPIPVLFNSMVIMIVPGNGVVFNCHPAAKKVSAKAVTIFERVIRENGGPPNLITMLREPTLEGAQQLFAHRAVRLIAATGGPGLVRAAFAAGKKVVAAGPGNPPVLVDETASLRSAARHIIDGASFENNIICFAEKEAFVVGSVYDEFMRAMADEGAVRLSKQQVERLADQVFQKDDRGRASVSRDFIGKNASVLARAVGLSVPDNVRLLYGEATFDCLFVQEEQMMPYLPVVRVKDAAEGIDLAVRAEHGYGHSAVIHSNNLDVITAYTKAVNSAVVVVNGPSLAGDGGYGGEGTFTHTIASPTGEGICTPRHFAKVRRMAMFRHLQMR